MEIEFLSSLRPGSGPGPGTGPTTVVAERYRNLAHFRDEARGVLHQSWIVAGHSSAVATKGHLLVWDGFDQSVVVARDAECALHAFHYVCQPGRPPGRRRHGRPGGRGGSVRGTGSPTT
jgi:hypothetical protein